MAQKVQFLGFKKILSSAKSSMAENFLYFVRDNGSAVEGELWFNGTCYGKCRDIEINDIKRTLADFLSGGTASGTTVKDYIDEAVSAITSGMTTSVELDPDAFSGLTIEDKSTTPNVKDYVINLQNVAREDLLEKEIQDREDADEALQAELDDVEAAVGLSTGGTYVPGDGKFTSGATSVADAIDKLDDALASAVTDLEETIEEKINELDATVSATSTNSYMTVQVVEENGKLTSVSLDDSALNDAIEAMDLAQVHEAGKAIIAVSEEDGVVSATAGTVTAQYVDVADAAGKFTGTTVEAILAEIDSAYKAADEAIVGDATTSGNTLGKLEDRIEALDADAKEYHIVKITEGLPATIKERYELQDASGNTSGATIDLPKDSHIVSITYITEGEHAQNLEYVYIDVCGATRTEYVDMSELVLETEFASGVTVTNGIAHGVVDPQSETFLTVGADGFKLSGVQDAIDDAKDDVMSALTETAATLTEMIENAASAATTEVVEGTDAGNNLSIAESAGADGHKIYTINLNDVASASALTQEISDREDADEELQENLQTTADTLTAMIDDLTNGLQAELDAVETSLGFTDTAYTNSGTYICGTSVTNDIKLLDTALDTVEGNFTDALARETELRESGDTALDARLDVVEEKYITGATVNGVDATVTDHVADVTIDAGDIELGEEVTGTTGGIYFDATANTQDVFQSIVDVLNQSVAGSYTGVTSNDGSIIPTSQTNGQDLSVNTKTLALADVQAGETEVKKDQTTGALYGVMYWIDEETA